MNPFSVARGYLEWHYGRAFRDILSVWMNLTWFITHLFSLPLLARTLFSPWKRMQEQYERKGLESIFESLVLNILSRIFGAMVRFTIIVTGAMVLLFSALSIFCIFAFWIVAPAAIPALFFTGLALLF